MTESAKNGAETSVDEVERLVSNLMISETSDDCVANANALGESIKKLGVKQHLRTTIDKLLAAMQDKKSGYARESGALGMEGVIRKVGNEGEAHFVAKLPLLLELLTDRGVPVREAAQRAAQAVLDIPLSQYAIPKLLEVLTEPLQSSKWQAKLGAVKLLTKVPEMAPEQIGKALPSLIPIVTECLHDTKKEVSEAATECMVNLCSVANNRDLKPNLNILVDCFAHPEHLEDCIRKLAATTFVQDVTGPALAIVVPLLNRALNEIRSANVTRLTTVILDNVLRLVKDPFEAHPHLHIIKPSLEKVVEMAASPEVRGLATAALNTIKKIEEEYQIEKEIVEKTRETSTLNDVVLKAKQFIRLYTDGNIEPFFDIAVTYAAFIMHQLLMAENYEKDTWMLLCKPLLCPHMEKPDVAEKIIIALHSFYLDMDKKRRKAAQGFDETIEEGEELCNCDFSLAYGGMMLLTRTTLRLFRGKRYGLCGRNGAGKSTLMKAIGAGKVEGFPAADVVKTIYVAHALQGDDTSLPVIDFILADNRVKEMSLGRDKIGSVLNEFGFNADRIAQPVSALSGGWKMKLELARAMLLNADVLLLDEPTNHLDVENVAWLEQYLNKQEKLTSLIVSHDSGFLDNVCTDIIHYERKKLVYYKGNLSEFVKKRPEAKTYYTLSDSAIKFKFPPPTLLQGINSATKTILKIKDGSYTYPGASKPSISDISVSLSLSSRVAIVGPNGAGKSTLIKLLTGETVPQTGTVWKHPNLRVAYVAQHAFHHLNQHLEKTANQYIQWRYQGGEDREILEKATRQFTEQDLEQMKKFVDVEVEDRQGNKSMAKRRIEYIIGRQKQKKSFRYEVKWHNLEHRHNTWVDREQLLEWGFSKLVQGYDDRVASREGQRNRELVPSEIRRHLEDFGLDGDIGDYNPLASLSDGQKVKVVIAAALWNNSHCLILDEPTNYLDRDSLGGLAVAIRDWAGAVVMISHSQEFVGALCPEVWNVEAGRLTRTGVTEVSEEAFDDHVKNVTKKVDSRPKKKKLTRNELKAREARRRARELAWLNAPKGTPREPDTESD